VKLYTCSKQPAKPLHVTVDVNLAARRVTSSLIIPGCSVCLLRLLSSGWLAGLIQMECICVCACVRCNSLDCVRVHRCGGSRKMFWSLRTVVYARAGQYESGCLHKSAEMWMKITLQKAATSRNSIWYYRQRRYFHAWRFPLSS